MDAVAASGSSSSSKVASTDWLPITRMFGSSTIVDAARRMWARCSRFTRSPGLDQPGGRYRWWPGWAAHGRDASAARRMPRPVNAPLARSPWRRESSGAVPTLPTPEISARRQPRRLRRRAPLAIGPTSVPSCPPRVLGPQALQIPTHPRENVLWVLDQLGQHRPVQPQRTFLITRQFLLMHGSEKPVQLGLRDTTM